jgi:hypothetical protein
MSMTTSLWKVRRNSSASRTTRATAPGDYVATSGTLTFAPGVTSQTITIATPDDAVVEGSEFFTVTLASPTPAGTSLGSPSSATVTITDTDAPGVLQFATGSMTVVEGAPATVMVTRAGGTAGMVTVHYGTSDGDGSASAVAGRSYTATTGVLTFPSGVTSRAITVPTKVDSSLSGPRKFTVTLSDVGGGATLGALTDYDRNKEEAEKSWAWESWQGHYDWTAGTLRRVRPGPHRWHLDQLVVLRDDDRIRCGYVTRVALDNRGDLAISLKLWAGSATAIAVRALTTMLVEEPPAPALTLSATPDEKACVIVPPRTFSAGRVLRSVASGPERRLRLTRLIQRGADFERAAFEEAPA